MYELSRLATKIDLREIRERGERRWKVKAEGRWRLTKDILN